MTVRVVVAEDNYLVREGLVRLLEMQPEVEVLAAFEDYDALMAGVGDDPPDVVLTDIRMPPTGTDEGVRAANVLRASHPSIGVVVLSQYIEPEYALSLLEAGSDRRAYLLEGTRQRRRRARPRIETVAEGGSVIDPRVVETLVQARARRQSPLEFLTPRESEVLAEMALGRNNAGIAAALGLSERAVEKHINSLFAKLGVSEEPEVHRRVKAVLLHLAERS